MGLRVHIRWSLALLVVPAFGQEQLRQPPPVEKDSLKTSSVGFERVLNTFLWRNDLFYRNDFGGIEMDFRQRVRSRLIRSEQRSIQDELVDTLDLSGFVADQWKLRAQLASSVLSDNKAVDLSKLAQHQGLVGIQVQPSPRILVGAMGGYGFEAQQDQRDKGFVYMATMEGRDLALEEFRASFKSRWSQAFLSPRRPETGDLTVGIVRDFGKGARDSISFSYNKQRREFYTIADLDVQRLFARTTNIFRREAETFDVANLLEFRPGESTRLSVRGGVTNRTIDRGLHYKSYSSSSLLLDTKIQELQLYGAVVTSYQFASWGEADIAMYYTEREERHTVQEEEQAPLDVVERQERSERKLDNIARRTSVSSELRTRITEKDLLNFAGSASILRYDTPDTLNIDDRDELLITLGAQGIHQFSRHVTLSLTVDATLSHLVYLHRLQSANNNWNRILRFSPTVEYTPSSTFRTVNQAEVLANYTIYDFEEQAVLTKSFSFRQASWIDSTAIQLTRSLLFDFFGGVRVYERGVLLWSDFKERPEHYFVEKTFWPRITYAVVPSVRLGLGYRFFSQERFRYVEADRLLDRRLETFGPTVVFEWEGVGSQRIRLEGWRETQTQDGKHIRTIPNLSLKVSAVL